MGEIAKGWIARYEMVEKHGDGHPEAEKYFWAYDRLSTLVLNDPIGALQVVEEIYVGTTNDFVLENLGAGPMESLLVHAGRQIERELDRVLSRHPGFSESVLAHVWWKSVDFRLAAKFESP